VDTARGPPGPPPAPAAPLGGKEETSGGSPYASTMVRAGALLVDDTVWFVGALIALAIPPAVAGDNFYDDHETLAGLFVIAVASLWFNYFLVCEWRWGRTLGKQAMGIRVLADDGGPVSFGAASIRNLMRLVDFFLFLIGPILIAASRRHQRLGDRLAHTVVVRKGRVPEPVEAPPAVEAAAEPRRALPWVTWGPRTAVLGLLGGLALAAIVAPLLVLPFDPDLSSLGATLAAQALLTVALLGTAFHIARGEGAVDLRAAAGRLGWRRFRPSALALALGTLFVYFIAVAVYISLFGEPHQEDVGGDLGLDQGPLAAIAAVALIAGAAPIAEESFFRGFFFGGLRGRLPMWPAAVISGLVFGAVHAPEGPTAVVPLAMLGVALALLYERTGSLWPCIFAHCLNNSLALAVGT
jgi:membrane protease YdiL (CAAX protease family)